MIWRLAAAENDGLVDGPVLVAMVYTDVAEAGVFHEADYILRSVEMEIVFGEVHAGHFFAGTDGDGENGAFFEDAADFSEGFVGVGPEINGVDGEGAIENGSSEGHVGDVANLHAQAALLDFTAEIRLGFVDHVGRNVDAGDGGDAIGMGEALEGIAAAEADFQDVMLLRNVEELKSGVDDFAIVAIE